jgi:hypothetical protein
VRAHGPFNAASSQTDLSATDRTPVSPWACQAGLPALGMCAAARLLQRVCAQWRDLARASTMNRCLVIELYQISRSHLSWRSTGVHRAATS